MATAWRSVGCASCPRRSHATGAIEYLLVAVGHVTTGSVDATQGLGSGGMLAFTGDAPHFYRTAAEAADNTVVFAAPVST